MNALEREIEQIISDDTERLFRRIDDAAYRAGVHDFDEVAKIVRRFGGSDLEDWYQDYCDG